MKNIIKLNLNEYGMLHSRFAIIAMFSNISQLIHKYPTEPHLLNDLRLHHGHTLNAFEFQ